MSRTEERREYRASRSGQSRMDAWVVDFVWVGAHLLSDREAERVMGVERRTIQRWRARMRDLAALEPAAVEAALVPNGGGMTAAEVKLAGVLQVMAKRAARVEVAA